MHETYVHLLVQVVGSIAPYNGYGRSADSTRNQVILITDTNTQHISSSAAISASMHPFMHRVDTMEHRKHPSIACCYETDIFLSVAALAWSGFLNFWPGEFLTLL